MIGGQLSRRIEREQEDSVRRKFCSSVRIRLSVGRHILDKTTANFVAIDVWSAGIMLLSMLTCKFPIFNSSDDVEALMEIAALFGRSAMEKCAFIHRELPLLFTLMSDRTMITNVPTLDTPPPTFSTLVTKLNPHVYTPPTSKLDPEDARQHIEMIDAGIDLCRRMLRLDSTNRITAAAALKHRFFGDHAETDEDDVEILEGTEGKCGELHGFIKGQREC
jgi:cell division control protein 7